MIKIKGIITRRCFNFTNLSMAYKDSGGVQISQKKMLRLSFYLVFFHLHLLTIKSAAVLSNSDLHVEQLLQDGDFTVYCKSLIQENIISKSSQEWCALFDLSKDLIVGINYCDRTGYEELTRAACTKEGSVVMTTQTKMAATPTSYISTPESIFMTTMEVSREILKTQSTSSPYIKLTSTDKYLLGEQIETSSHTLTTADQRRQTNDNVMSSSDTTINTRKLQNPGSTTVHDLLRSTETDQTLENSLEDLLQQVLDYKNKTDYVDECKTVALTKLTRGNDVTRVCATIKQLKVILDDKCVKTDYDLLVVETLQLFGCLVCHL
ncbi:unnamed protein product [Lymnaea stagnalis]|uniref:Uncharacterized protein n=1 Tax=Lymnaea stagnalis TaxID=6523 RepID=A0AAV2IFQ4_LYMST